MSSGAARARSPFPSPLATVRLRRTSSATVDGERPSASVIDRHDSRLSSPRSMEARSAFVSLKQRLCFSFMMLSFPSAGPFGPFLRKGTLGLIRTRSAKFERKTKVYGSTCKSTAPTQPFPISSDHVVFALDERPDATMT